MIHQTPASPCVFRLSTYSACTSALELNATQIASFSSRFDGRTIAFVGDSLVRQQFHQLICLLSRRMDVRTVSRRYWECKTLECLNLFTRIVMRAPATNATVILQSRWLKGFPIATDLEPHLITSAHAIVFGIGAFVSKSAMEATMLQWERTWLHDVRVRGGIILWLEYFAGHANTTDGEYAGSSHSEYFTVTQRSTALYPCVPLSEHGVFLARANPRHADGNRVAHRLGWPIVPTFDQALDRHMDHPGVSPRAGVGNVTDCRHWSACSDVVAHRTVAILEALMVAHVHAHVLSPPIVPSEANHKNGRG